MNLQSTWICDTCGQVISSAEQGQLVMRYSTDKQKYVAVQIVHKSTDRKESCSFKKTSEFTNNDLELSAYTDASGLNDLLHYIAFDRFEDKEQILEIIKRIFVRDYEIVRNVLDEAADDAVFEPNMPIRYSGTSDIAAVKQWLEENGRMPQGFI